MKARKKWNSALISKAKLFLTELCKSIQIITQKMGREKSIFWPSECHNFISWIFSIIKLPGEYRASKRDRKLRKLRDLRGEAKGISKIAAVRKPLQQRREEFCQIDDQFIEENQIGADTLTGKIDSVEN